MTSDQWWTDRRINNSVTEEFIRKVLDAKHHRVLKARVFDDELSDDTYLDLILNKARRCFLILRDIGHPELIFDLIDKNFTDDDVPIAAGDEAAWSTLVSIRPKLDVKFDSRQYYYCLKELEPGRNIDYTVDEVVPATTVDKGIHRGLATVKKVMIGKSLLFRRKYPLEVHSGSKETIADTDPFRYYFHELSLLQHSHITRVWSTYTQGCYGYVLYGPTSTDTLKDALSDSTKYFKQSSKEDQRRTLLRWAFSLTCGLDYMHHHGLSHQAIRPDNVYLDNLMNITLGESAALEDFHNSRPGGYERLQYLHGSPEQWQRKRQVLQASVSIQPRPPTGARSSRPDPVSQSAPRLSTALFKRGGNLKNAPAPEPSSARPMSPLSVVPPIRNGFGSLPSSRGSAVHSMHSSSDGSIDYNPSLHRQSVLRPSQRPSHSRMESDNGVYENPTRPRKTIISPINFSHLATSSSDQSPLFPSDVFALATILVEIITVILSTSSSSFSFTKLVSHLGKRNRQAGRGGGGGAPVDSSFHANLDQAFSWLDSLSKGVAEALHKAAKQRGKGKSKAVDGADDTVWLHATAELIELARHGLEADPRRRITAAEFHAEMVRISERHAVGAGQCCGATAPAILNPSAPTIGEAETSQRGRRDRSSVATSRSEIPVLEGFSPTRSRTNRSDSSGGTTPNEFSYGSPRAPNRPLPRVPELEGDRAYPLMTSPPQSSHGIMDVGNMQVVGPDRYELPSPEPMTPESQKSTDDNDVNESLYEYFSEEDEDEDDAEKRIAKSAVGRIPSLKDIPLPDAWREKRTMAFRMTGEPGKYQFGNIGKAL